MRKNLTEIVFILDRSGSMSGLEADTIGGYNSLLDKQKKEKDGQLFQQFYLMICRRFFTIEWIWIESNLLQRKNIM